MSKFKTLIWGGCLCNLIPARFWNGRLALLLNEADTGLPAGRATVNLEHEDQAWDEVFVKDHFENEGMIEALQKARVIEAPTEWIQTGFTKAARCKLVDPAFWGQERPHE